MQRSQIHFSFAFVPLTFSITFQIAMLESELGGVNKTMKSLSVQGGSLFDELGYSHLLLVIGMVHNGSYL